MPDDVPPTKSQIRKAGDVLRRQLRERELIEVEQDAGNARSWEVVRRFRRQHVVPTAGVVLELWELASELGFDPPASRIKRAERIVEKIARSSSGLERLQDIGGCRIVVPDLAAQSRVTHALENNSLGVVTIADYVSDAGTSPFSGSSPGPRGSGYRAVHIIHRIDGLLVETQVRTARQHYWAMSAEEAEQITGFAVKVGDAPPDLLEYFRVAGEIEGLKDLEADVDADLVEHLGDLRERIRVYYRRTG